MDVPTQASSRPGLLLKGGRNKQFVLSVVGRFVHFVCTSVVILNGAKLFLSVQAVQ